MDKHEFYIADFCCWEKGLIIELDGEIHDSQKEIDDMRDKILHSCQYTVLRFTNNDVIDNLAFVIEQIRLKLK
jgi:very-short-patch-repair endonuclease